MRALERLHTIIMTMLCNSAHGTQLKMCSERVLLSTPIRTKAVKTNETLNSRQKREKKENNIEEIQGGN